MHRALAAAGFLGATAIVGLLAAGWYFSDVLRRDGLSVDHQRPRDLKVLAVADGTITVETSDPGAIPTGLGQDGIWGLEWDGGYGRLGRVVAVSGSDVTREFLPASVPPAIGTRARLDGWAFPGDPATAFGLPGRLIISVRPRRPAIPRESIAKGVF